MLGPSPSLSSTPAAVAQPGAGNSAQRPSEDTPDSRAVLEGPSPKLVSEQRADEPEAAAASPRSHRESSQNKEGDSESDDNADGSARSAGDVAKELQSKKRKRAMSETYEIQIIKALNDVMTKSAYYDVVNRIKRCLNRYRATPEKCVIQATLPKKDNDKKGSRGSLYRGPSKNRKKWQVMKMLNKDTIRIGGIKSEMDAARIYDFIAILTQGLSVSIKHIILFISYLFHRQKRISIIMWNRYKSS